MAMGKVPTSLAPLAAARPSPLHDAVVENSVTMHHRMQATPQHELEKKRDEDGSPWQC